VVTRAGPPPLIRRANRFLNALMHQSNRYNQTSITIMKSRILSVLTTSLLGLLAMSSSLPAADASAAARDAQRKKFVDEFKRIGLNTAPEDAMFLRILVESRKAQRGVEVGSATGFGAVNMGIAFERTGGHLYTIDIDPKMIEATRANLKKIGLEKTVTAIEGDALQELGKLKGKFDFVFIDAVKRDYFKYFKLIEPKLKPGAVIVADNVIVSAKEMQDFLDYMKNSPDYDTVIIRASLEKKDGMAVCYKIR
jgi:predicted O-methyltransferase YrrM